MHYLKQLLIVVLSVTLLGSIASCGYGRSRHSDEYIADTMFEHILESIENEDSEALKALFSKAALLEADDIDANVEHLFALIEGDVVSWEREGVGSSESVRSGKRSELIRSWFILETTQDRYYFFLLDYNKNTINPDLEGLYTIRAVKYKDEEEYITSRQEMKIPGIYIPEEYFQTESTLPDE